MNRNQRRLGRLHQKRSADYKINHENKIHRHNKAVDVADLLEVLPPKANRNPSKIEKFTTNKCCYVAPLQEDFGQLTSTEKLPENDKYQNTLQEQYGFNPLASLIPDTTNQLKELRKVLCNNVPKVENGSQYASDKQLSVQDLEETDSSQWQNIDNADEIDNYIAEDKQKPDSCLYLPENTHISEIPRIKIIAKKFTRFKKNNVELRRLDEKVVCVEYDVFFGDGPKSREKLRAFFSVKPTHGKEDQQEIISNQVPSRIRNDFNISNEDLKKLNEKEIEIIDGKITENKTYLEDLKRILRRKQAIHAKKNKNTLDLMSLYEMAKRGTALDDRFSNTNCLSKAELQEIKDLILTNCASSVQGISRRTVKKNPEVVNSIGGLSQSIMAEVCREINADE